MNLHALVRGTITAINPDRTISLKRSNGYTTSANGKQVPTYAATVSGVAQIQALSGGDLRHMNNLNITGIMRKVYLYGNWMGIIRTDKTGGDVLTFPQVPGGADQDWNVVSVFETWDTWCAVGVVLQ
jgi:hypothetical protein